MCIDKHKCRPIGYTSVYTITYIIIIIILLFIYLQCIHHIGYNQSIIFLTVYIDICINNI